MLNRVAATIAVMHILFVTLLSLLSSQFIIYKVFINMIFHWDFHYVGLVCFKLIMGYKPGSTFRHLQMKTFVEIWLPLSGFSSLAVNMMHGFAHISLKHVTTQGSNVLILQP
jgi:hypothetical protein